MFFGLVGCSEPDYDIAFISIVNDTEYAVDIKILRATDKDGRTSVTTLDSIFGNYVVIFDSYDETIDPCVFLSNECDSIVVTIDNSEGSKIFFGKHSTPNYSSNPFKDADAWSYEIKTQATYRATDNNVITKHDYSLVISTDSIVENTPN